jgi:hypothetical protein
VEETWYSGTDLIAINEQIVYMHFIFQPNIKTSDEYKRGERTEQLDDSPKTEFQVRGTFCGRSTVKPLTIIFVFFVFLKVLLISSGSDNLPI